MGLHGGGRHSQWASRVSSLMAFDMPILRPPAGVSQWVAGPTTPVVCWFTALEVKGLLDQTGKCTAKIRIWWRLWVLSRVPPTHPQELLPPAPRNQHNTHSHYFTYTSTLACTHRHVCNSECADFQCWVCGSCSVFKCISKLFQTSYSWLHSIVGRRTYMKACCKSTLFTI